MSDPVLNDSELPLERCPFNMELSHTFCSAGTCGVCKWATQSRPMTDDEKKLSAEFFLSKFKP